MTEASNEVVPPLSPTKDPPPPLDPNPVIDSTPDAPVFKPVPLKNRLHSKLIVAFIVLGLGPSLLTGTYSYQQIDNSFKTQVNQNIFFITELLKSRVTETLNDADKNIKTWSDSRDAVNAAGVVGKTTIVFEFLQKRFRNFLIAQTELLPMFERILCVAPAKDPSGSARILYSTKIEEENQLIYPGFWDGLNDSYDVNPQFRWDFRENNSQKIDWVNGVIPIARQYLDGEGHSLAIVGLIKLTAIKELVENIAVGDHKLKELAPTKETMAGVFTLEGHQIGGTFPNGLLDVNQAQRLITTLSENPHATFFSNPALGEIMADEDRTKFLNWSFITVKDADLALKPLAHIKNASIISGILFLIVFVIFSVQISKRIADPLNSLVRVTQIVASGNLDERASETSEDEIGLLGRSFNTMVSDIQSFISRLKQMAAIQKDLELAGAVQQLLLPKFKTFENKYFKLSTHYQSTNHSGGDWWWFIELQDKSVLILMGDVTGHGVESSIVTASVAGTCWAFYNQLNLENVDSAVPMILTSLNKNLWAMEDGRFWMTFSILHMSPSSRKMTWWGAGAPPIFIMDQTGKTVSHYIRSFALGTQPKIDIQCRSFDIEEKSRVFLFTDGAFEFKDKTGEVFGHRNLLRMVQDTRNLPTAEARSEIAEKIAESCGTNRPDDDITFTVVDCLTLT